MYKSELIAAKNRIQPFIHHTPVLTCETIDKIAGTKLYFKCENFQKTGSFKVRGALNALLQLNGEQKMMGVVTHSSGNHAQAIAYAAKALKMKAYIVMPNNSPKTKVEATKKYGGIISFCNPTIADREQMAAQIQKEKKATFIHPSNNLQVILGQGTISYELLHIEPHIETIIAPIGGGGLIAGLGLSNHHFGINLQTFGSEPKEANDAFRSLDSGRIEYNTKTKTIADGLRTNLGDINFPIIRDYVKKIILVEEQEIIDAMQLIWERMKIIVEPSAAVPLAAILKEKKRFENKKIGIILSGGNVDLKSLPF